MLILERIASQQHRNIPIGQRQERIETCIYAQVDCVAAGTASMKLVFVASYDVSRHRAFNKERQLNVRSAILIGGNSLHIF